MPILDKIKFQDSFNPLYTSIVSTKAFVAAGGKEMKMSQHEDAEYYIHGCVWKCMRSCYW